MAKKPMSVGVKAALITGSATILVAIIGLVTTTGRKPSAPVHNITNSAPSISYNINSGAKSVTVAGGNVGSINTGDSTVNYNYANSNKPEFYLIVYDGKNPIVVKNFASISQSTPDTFITLHGLKTIGIQLVNKNAITSINTVIDFYAYITPTDLVCDGWLPQPPGLVDDNGQTVSPDLNHWLWKSNQSIPAGKNYYVAAIEISKSFHSVLKTRFDVSSDNLSPPQQFHINFVFEDR